jgi:uncharacterized protein YbcI
VTEAGHDVHLAQLADADELERSGADSRAGSADGGQRAAVANAMVGMKKEFYGKGPVAAKAYFADDWIFVVLEGGLTRNEETLLAAGQTALVREVRLRFQEAMTETVTGAVAEIVGRRILTYHSQIMFDPVRTVEMFLLEPVQDL